MKLITEMRLAQ